MPEPPRTRLLIRSVLVRIAVVTGLWWAITEGYPGAWVAGGLVIVGAVTISLALVPPTAVDWRLMGVLRFLPFFLRQSVRGGIDVAVRAVHPRLPIEPAFVEYQLALPEGYPRAFFISVLSLLPGTLSARLVGDTLTVHLLDRRLPSGARIAELEIAVAEIFGLEI